MSKTKSTRKIKALSQLNERSESKNSTKKNHSGKRHSKDSEGFPPIVSPGFDGPIPSVVAQKPTTDAGGLMLHQTEVANFLLNALSGFRSPTPGSDQLSGISLWSGGLDLLLGLAAGLIQSRELASCNMSEVSIHQYGALVSLAIQCFVVESPSKRSTLVRIGATQVLAQIALAALGALVQEGWVYLSPEACLPDMGPGWVPRGAESIHSKSALSKKKACPPTEAPPWLHTMQTEIAEIESEANTLINILSDALAEATGSNKVSPEHNYLDEMLYPLDEDGVSLDAATNLKAGNLQAGSVGSLTINTNQFSRQPNLPSVEGQDDMARVTGVALQKEHSVQSGNMDLSNQDCAPALAQSADASQQDESIQWEVDPHEGENADCRRHSVPIFDIPESNSLEEVPFAVYIMCVCTVALSSFFLGLLPNSEDWINFVTTSDAMEALILTALSEDSMKMGLFPGCRDLVHGCLSSIDATALQACAVRKRKQRRAMLKAKASPCQRNDLSGLQLPSISPSLKTKNSETIQADEEVWDPGTGYTFDICEIAIRDLLKRQELRKRRLKEEKQQCKQRLKELRKQKQDSGLDLKRRLFAAAKEAAEETSRSPMRLKLQSKVPEEYNLMMSGQRPVIRNSIKETLAFIFRPPTPDSRVPTPASVHSQLNSPGSALEGQQTSDLKSNGVDESFVKTEEVTVGQSLMETMLADRQHWEEVEMKEMEYAQQLKEQARHAEVKAKEELQQQIREQKELIEQMVQDKKAQRLWEKKEKKKVEKEIQAKELERISELRAIDEKRKKEENRQRLVLEQEEKMRFKRWQRKLEKEKQDEEELQKMREEYNREVAENAAMQKVEREQRKREALAEKYRKFCGEKEVYENRVNYGNFEWKRGKLLFKDDKKALQKEKQRSKHNKVQFDTKAEIISNWVACDDSYGGIFWYNKKTGASSWEKPF